MGTLPPYKFVKMQKDLTQGNIIKTIAYFSLPYLLSYFLQTLYGMADLFIIGQFNSVDATTAVSIGSQVMHMITVIIVGLAMGASVMIGRATGAKDNRQSAKTIGNTVTLFAAVSIVLTTVLVFCVKPLTKLMATPGEAIDGTVKYLTICFIGIPFITAYNVIASVFRGMGDSKSPMYFIAVACAFNIGLDYIFIGLLNMGAAGAALGTTLAQMASVIISLIVIQRKKLISGLQKSDFKPQKNTIFPVLKVGIPISMQDGFIQIAFIIITVFANKRGLTDAGAVGIVEKLIGIIFLVPSTMLSTVSSLSALNIGAKKHARVQKILLYSTLITVIYGVIISMIMQFCAENAVALFTDSAEVTILGGQYMRSYVWDCVFAGIHFCFSGYFCAYGLSNISFLHNFLSIVLARIPISYYASVQYTDTLFPMGAAAPIGSVLSVIICAAYIWLQKRKDKYFI